MVPVKGFLGGFLLEVPFKGFLGGVPFGSAVSGCL